MKWAVIIFAATFVTFGLAGIVFAFIYNRLYIQNLLKQHFDKSEIKLKIDNKDYIFNFKHLGRGLSEHISLQTKKY